MKHLVTYVTDGTHGWQRTQDWLPVKGNHLMFDGTLYAVERTDQATIHLTKVGT